MRALVQRVSEASVWIGGEQRAAIGPGLVVLIGVRSGDTDEQAERLARKVCGLRIFTDAERAAEVSVSAIKGELLVVSQFTLYANTDRGNRPSYSQAAAAKEALPLYEKFVKFCMQTGLPVKTGVFQANMEVRLINQGPVTLLFQIEAEQSR